MEENILKNLYDIRVKDKVIYSFEEWSELFNNILEGYEYDLQTYEADSYDLIIKIPDAICTDIYGNQTPINNLYFKFNISKHDSRLYAIRSSLTKNQYRSSYCHSHISFYGFNWSPSVCFGNINVYDSVFINNLIKFMSVITYFVEHESTNTRPYSKISNIIDSSRVMEIFGNYWDAKYLNMYQLKEKIVQNRLVCDIELMPELLKIILENEPVIEEREGFYKRKIDSITNNLPSSTSLFNFKGQKIYSEIVKDEEDTIEHNFIPNPYRINWIKQQIILNNG